MDAQLLVCNARWRAGQGWRPIRFELCADRAAVRALLAVGRAGITNADESKRYRGETQPVKVVNLADYRRNPSYRRLNQCGRGSWQRAIGAAVARPNYGDQFKAWFSHLEYVSFEGGCWCCAHRAIRTTLY